MAQGPMSSILLTIQITVRIQESEVRVHWIIEKVEVLWRAGVRPRE